MGKTLRRVSRYTEILGVLVRYGFYDLVRSVDTRRLRRLRGESRASRRARRAWSRAEGMRLALEELGPTFVKIGQLLSHRPDMLPPEWIREFEKLRANVAPVDFDDVRALIGEELGAPPEELFAEFEQSPIASASIAQVHRARLGARAPDGSSSSTLHDVEVAVKVQRPGIRRIIEADLAILHDVARTIERRVPSLAVFRPVDAVAELERALQSELDFRNEADNMETFRNNFAKDPTVTAPRPFRNYSSRRILTMTFLKGVPVGNVEALESIGADRVLLARRGARSVLRQIFEHRFFHSDPHGNNIIILPENVIAFLDFGQVGTVLPSQRRFLADLLTALIRFDAPRAVRAIMTWSGYRDPDIARSLLTDVEGIIERYLSRPFGRIDVGQMIGTLIGVIRRYEITIPSNFQLLAKAMTTIEDIASGLDPEFDFIRASRPFARHMIWEELSPRHVSQHVANAAEDAMQLLRDLPGESRDLVSLLKAGKLRIEFGLKDAKVLDSTISRTVTRLSAAVLLASMIMGSSILVQSLIPPLVFGIPVIGVAGFLASGAVAVVLLFDLLRHR